MKIAKRRAMKNILLACIILLVVIGWIDSQAVAQTEKIPRGGTLKMIHTEPIHLNSALGGGSSVVIPACQIFAGLL
ncbi:MAG: hypothetical protein KKH04_16200 [Proteobacteria bacterium]|nr:hypothetical protein [Pseudomonadota bacterium]